MLRRLVPTLIVVASCGARSELLEPAPLDASLTGDAADARDARDARDADDGLCGNGRIDPGEQCDLGDANALIPAFGVAQNGVELPISPVVRHESAAAFYDYNSASAHTRFESPGASLLFLYCDPSDSDDLGLFVIHGRDDLGGSHQPSARVTGSLRGVPAGATLAVSDDPGEFHAGAPGEFDGNWTFNDNTDGGAIAGLPWDSAWTITARMLFIRGVSSWHAVRDDGWFRVLTIGTPTQLIHHVLPSACRPDCQLPRCGDRFTDGGERCDDGNTTSNDGCSGDCSRLE
jgi:cysteine-rich repeat protein